MLLTFQQEATAHRQSAGLRHDQPAVPPARRHVSVQAWRLVSLAGLLLYWAWPSVLCAAVLRETMGKRCAPNLQTHGWRISSDTWMPKLAKMSTCEDGGRSVFPNGASRGSQGQPVNISWVYVTIAIIQHTTVSDLLGEVDVSFYKQNDFTFANVIPRTLLPVMTSKKKQKNNREHCEQFA